MAEPKVRVNREIRVKEVRVIGPEGEQVGILPTYQAIKKAEEYGLDLVEVSPTAKPPVCRVMDFGKYKYEQAKKQHSARVHQRSMQLKEIKLRPYTDTHDLEVKIRNVRRFLEDKNKAKITVSFRGRERAHTEIGRPLMEAIWEGVKDIGMIDAPTKMEGDNMIMIVSPKAEILKPKKPHNPAAPTGLSDVKADVRADVKALGEENIIIEGRENEQDKT